MSIVTYMSIIFKYVLKEMREFCNFFVPFFKKSKPPQYAEALFYDFLFEMPKARRKIGAISAGGFNNTIFTQYTPSPLPWQRFDAQECLARSFSFYAPRTARAHTMIAR